MKSIGLLHIEKVSLPKEFVNEIYIELQKTGEQGLERLALLAGKKKGSEFVVTHLLFPAQKLSKSIYGVSFHVSGEELERIWDWLFANNCFLIAQVHSHPQKAYHSEADDELAIITTFGGFSIVIPNFGNSDTNFEGSAFFRLLPESGWTELTRDQIDNIFKITE